MKNTRFLLSALVIILTLSLSAQKQTYEFRTSPVSSKSQAEVGKDYYYVSFVIKGIKNEAQKKILQKSFSSNPQFKKVSINKVNEFHGFIHKSLDAHKVREILLAQGFDFKFDRYKFKGCYLNEQLKQEVKK